jgi:hypothetical protein
MQMSDQRTNQTAENPFLALGFFEFAAVSAVTIAFFPLSLVICWFAFGAATTRHLINALLKDFVQTLVITGLVVLTIIAALVYGVWQWITV